MTKTGWIVWEPTYPKTPSIVHKTRKEAEDEAHRLALCNKGKEYYGYIHEIRNTNLQMVMSEATRYMRKHFKFFMENAA